VLLDGEGRVAVVNVRKYGYYKIPGGGVEEGEGLEESAKREVLEEAGCECEIIGSLGRKETDVPGWDLHDVSDGFVAKVVGEKKPPHFDDYEEERGFSLEWHDSLDAAISTMGSNSVSDPDAAALQLRDLVYLKLAKEYLDNQVRRADIDFQEHSSL